MDEDFDVDDILANKNKKKKKKDSKDKGGRGERLLIKKLEKRFPNKPFSRTIGSGNRWSQANLSETAKQFFTGDITAPDNFIFALECKKGYNDINLQKAVKRLSEGKKGNALLDSFLLQARKDANRINKKPLVCWSKDYEPWICFLEKVDFPKSLEKLYTYREWGVVLLSDLLEQPDEFFFK